MNIRNKKQLVADIMKVGKKRVRLDPSQLDEISKAITKADIRSLIAAKKITIKPIIGNSKFRSRKIKLQKSKGRRKGKGSRKGKKTSRLTRKRAWISKVRAQRAFIKKLKEKNLITKPVHRDIYKKIMSNAFRNTRLIKIYLGENKLIKK